MYRIRNYDDCSVIARQFRIAGKIMECKPIQGGLINKTYFIKTSANKYILQLINQNVFHDIDLLMNNIVSLSHHLYGKGYYGIKVVKTQKGEYYLPTNTGQYWRMYLYIDDTYTINSIRTSKDARNYGSVIGNFLIQMIGLDESMIHDPIPNFHDTRSRYNNFIRSLEKDSRNRAQLITEEIKYLIDQWDFIDSVCCALENESINNGIIHNDVRINNVLFDVKTDEPVCLIDYDTIMKGKRIFDFCDGFRFATTYDTLEYESPSKVKIDLDLAHSYIYGYWKICGKHINEDESNVAISCSRLLTLENGMRLLTDYLNGDVYFSTDYPSQNLIRWKRHRQLLDDIDMKQHLLESIVKEVSHHVFD